MPRRLCRLAVSAAIPLVLTVAAASAQTAAEKAAARAATRDKLGAVLEASGAKRGIELAFRRSEKNEFNFSAQRSFGLKNVDSIEIVAGVSDDETISFRIYPYVNDSYININKAKDGAGLMRKLLNLTYHNFMYWGADDSGDVYAGFTFTMESGFPDKAIEVVLYSIAPLDGYFGELRPLWDGVAAKK
jgi:hypothetical protein